MRTIRLTCLLGPIRCGRWSDDWGRAPQSLLRGSFAEPFEQYRVARRDSSSGLWRRDVNGHEIDAIVSLRSGAWGAFEVKLNPTDVDEAAASLVRFANKVDTSTMGNPQVLAVITSTGMAFRRTDGVYVIPIASLGP